MFWNLCSSPKFLASREINFNIRCFEILFDVLRRVPDDLINFNIRCFEMQFKEGIWRLGQDDKLQHKMFWNFGIPSATSRPYSDKLQHKMFWNIVYSNASRLSISINFNIRCFEIKNLSRETCSNRWINFNIRCFEILKRGGRKIGKVDKLQHKMFWNSAYWLYPCGSWR